MSNLKDLAKEIDVRRVQYLDELAKDAWLNGIIINSVSFEGNSLEIPFRERLDTPPPILNGEYKTEYMNIKITAPTDKKKCKEED